MDAGFWTTLPRPIIGLSPMDGVTDAAFRLITARIGHPAVTMTEFTAAEGIRAGADRLLTDFLYHEEERPVVAQLFGADPAAFTIAAAVACALGFDGIDINMGCPAKNITEKGAGASLILDPERAKAIVAATKRGIRAWADGESLSSLKVPENIVSRISKPNPARRSIPVSIKTRIGYDQVVIEDWVQHLLETAPAAITIHGRTLKQLYSGSADWDAIARAAGIIHSTETLALGNGDIVSLESAHDRITQTGVDGVLIGRASFGNPWVFTGHTPAFEERIATALEHARIHHALFGDHYFLRMRKHLSDYTRGFDGAREMRTRLMHVRTLADVEEILLQ